MNHKSILLLFCCLIAPLSTAFGVPNDRHIPYNQIPEITPGELLIRVTPDALAELKLLNAKASLSKLHNQMGVQSVDRVFPYIAYPKLNPNLERIYRLRFPITVDLNALKAIYTANPLVEAVEFNYLRPTLASEVVPNDPRYGEQWNLPLINMPQAWAIEKGDPNVVIAIIDVGFDYKHEDLASKTWVNPGEIPDNGIDDDGNGYIDDVHGWDFTDAPNVAGEGDFLEGDNEPIDETGHGTHVAGIAGAAVDNGVGVAGVAWNCTLMPVRSGLSLGGSTNLQDDDSSAAVIYAVDNGARVINMSWGSKHQSFVISDMIDYAHARGALLVGAAGNSREPESIFPAGYRKVLSVASTEQNKEQFYQSNFGASVDIGAPGNVILSTQINNRYRELTGTSMAAPHVVGVAALVWSKRPNLTNEEVRHILVSTADPIAESPGLVGAGNLNAERALMVSGSLKARISSPETNSGGSNTIEIIGTAGGFKFDRWQLMFGESTTPEAFKPINPLTLQQKVSETLLVWDVTAVPEATYTIRLEVVGKDNRTVHDQVVVFVDRTPPKVQNVRVRNWISTNNFLSVGMWATDDFSINSVSQRVLERVATPFAQLEETSASREHIFFLSPTPGQYGFSITARNAAGLEAVDDNNGKFYRADVVGGSISQNGYVEIPIGLSSMHLGSVTADFDRDGQLEIVGLPLAGDLVSGVEIYEQSTSGKYQLQHTGTIVFKPWAVDDTDGDGLLEILGSTKERTLLVESLTRTGYPEKVIWETSQTSAGQIADLDGDGRKEIIGPNNNTDELIIFENLGNNNYHEIIRIKNETEGSNIFGEQFAIGDFDADSRMELMVGDSEGELFIYESIGDNQLRETWRAQIEAGDVQGANTGTNGGGTEGSALSKVEDAHQLAVGDLTGDGISEFVVGSIISETDLPSIRQRRTYTVFTTIGDNRYAPLWSQEIVPYRLRENSVAVGDVDGDQENELVIVANPSIYVFKPKSHLEVGGSRLNFAPVWHHLGETPHLLLADIDQDGFEEFYFNSNKNLIAFENARAKNPNTAVSIQPEGLSATPLSERVVRVAWNAPEGAVSFTVYRAVGEVDTEDDSTSPPTSAFKTRLEDWDVPGFIDRQVKKDTTYWYAITAKDETGLETDRTTPVSVTPRTPPKLIAVEHLQENQIAVTFDRRMALSIGDARRYVLREPQHLTGRKPVTAIRDRMGIRAVLTFRTGDLAFGKTYELTVEGVTDIDRNPIDLRASTKMLELLPETDAADIKDFSQAIVYPNPVRPNEFHKSAVTFDRLPTDTTIEIYDVTGKIIDTLTVKPTDSGRAEWLILSNGTAEVTSGIYVYVMAFESVKKTGKIAVIK